MRIDPSRSATPLSSPQNPNAPAPTSGFADVLARLAKNVDRGEVTASNAVAKARSGADFSPAELLALQSGIYQYSEAIDLGAKLVDRACNGVKTVLSGQGG